MLIKPIVAFFLVLICVTTQQVFAQSEDSLSNIIANGNKIQQLRAGVELAKKQSSSKFEGAIYTTEKLLPIAFEFNDTVACASLLRSKGISYYFIGEYDKAAASYFEAVALIEKKGNTRALAEVYELIARLYRKTHELGLALNYYQRAMQIFKSINDLPGISTIYNESGVVYEYQQQYNKAVDSYQKSLEISKHLNDKVGVAYALSNLGTVYRLTKQFDQGELYLKQAYQIRNTLHDTFALALSASDLGIIYQAWGKYALAIKYFTESNKVAQQLHYKELLSANYLALAQVYASIYDYELAYDFQSKHKNLSDSIFTEQRAAQVAELQTKYDTQKKDIAIVEQANALSKKQTQLVITLISLIALIFITGLWYNQNKLKQKALLQKTLLEQQVLQNQVMMEAEERERTRIARELHDGVGQQLSAAKLNLSAFENRLSLEQQKEFLVSIQLVDDAVKEVREISHNMMPVVLQNQGLKDALVEFVSRLNRGNAVVINLDVVEMPDKLSTAIATVLYRVVQESVSNALKHANANQISIQLVGYNDYVSLLIEDDGIGFDTKQNYGGIGLKNLTSRVALIGGTIDFDSTLGKGTTVVVSVPV